MHLGRVGISVVLVALSSCSGDPKYPPGSITINCNSADNDCVKKVRRACPSGHTTIDSKTWMTPTSNERVIAHTKTVIECTEPEVAYVLDAGIAASEQDAASSPPAAKSSSAYDRDKAVEEHCASRPGPAGAPAFDRRAASESITRAADEAGRCVRANGVSTGWVVFSLCGDGTVAEVAFDSSRGELTDRSLRSEWAHCVVEAFHKVKVPPYTGELVTVGKGFGTRTRPDP